MLTIIRGLPGSGKSTLAHALASNTPKAIHYEADMYFIRSGVYTFNPTELSDAHAWCKRNAMLALADGLNVFVSNTFTQQWEIRPYRDMAHLLNVPFFCIECRGNYPNVHNVPDDVIAKMKERWEVWP